jgi:hypothetical protein
MPNEVRAHIRRILEQLSKRSTDSRELELDVQPKNLQDGGTEGSETRPAAQADDSNIAGVIEPRY